MKQLYLYGASGHGKVIAEIAEILRWNIIGFIDNNQQIQDIIGYKVYHIIPKETEYLIVSIGNNKIRKEITARLNPFEYPVLVHPHAVLSSRVKVGEGTTVMAGVVVNSSSEIGKHCIINTNASIDHDCIIEAFVHLSPNVALAGNVFVGEGTHIGIGACVIQGIKIGKWCVIGAGSVIIKDIPDGTTVVGNPGRILEKIK